MTSKTFPESGHTLSVYETDRIGTDHGLVGIYRVAISRDGKTVRERRAESQATEREVLSRFVPWAEEVIREAIPGPMETKTVRRAEELRDAGFRDARPVYLGDGRWIVRWTDGGGFVETEEMDPIEIVAGETEIDDPSGEIAEDHLAGQAFRGEYDR